MEKCQLSFIGVGKMAGAIIGGVLNKELYTPAQIGVYDHTPKHLSSYQKKGCVCFESIPELTRSSEIIILSVKPQNFADILPLVKEGLQDDTIIVSIAAGISSQTLHDALGQNCKIILAGPNTPLLVGEGATVLSYLPPVGADDLAQVYRVFSASGMVKEISPTKMKEAIPVNGSSPAFVYLFADVLARSAQSVGLSYQVALELISQTLIGAANMMLETDKTPQELIEMVCSPGGTTLAGMEELEKAGFSQALENAFSACIYRAKELSGETVDQEEPDISVRFVTINTPEYDEVNQLRSSSLKEPLGLELTAEDLEEDSESIILAAFTKENQIAAVVLALVQDIFTARIRHMAILPDYYNSGIASILLAELEKHLKEKELTQIVLSAPTQYEEFYIRQGYQSRGEVFLESGIPNISMVKELK